MEEKDLFIQKLLSPKTKNVIISSKQKKAEKYINKVNSVVKKEKFDIYYIQSIIIYDIQYKDYIPTLFFYSNSLEMFVSQLNSFEFNLDLLKDFTLTLLNPQNADRTLLSKFKIAYGITKKKITTIFPLIENDLATINKNAIELYTMQKENKSKIFQIQKNKKKKSSIASLDEENALNDSTTQQNSFNNIHINTSSLISISREVEKFIKSKNTTNSLEVTKYLIDVLSQQAHGVKMTFRNIQRRVYDAINVMASIGIIQKDNNSIRYCNITKLNSIDKKEKIAELNEEIKEKKNFLISKLTEINCNKILIDKNKNSYTRMLTQDKLHVPFILINEDSTKNLIIRQSKNKQKLILLSKKNYELKTFDDFAKKISFENRNDILQLAEKIGGKDCKEYLQRKRLIEEYYEDMIEEDTKENKKNNEKEREKESWKRKKFFDVDFSCLYNNIGNNGSSLNSNGYNLSDNDDNKDNSENTSTNFYSKLSLI